MKNDNKKAYLSNIEKQKTPLQNEVPPEDAFIKLSIAAMSAADRSNLKNLSIDDDDVVTDPLSKNR